jgi:hypothetical protein
MKNVIMIQLIAGIVTVSLLWGCGGRSEVDDSIAKIDEAIEKVEKKTTAMTEEDWTAFAEELQEPCKVLKKELEDDRVGALKKIKILAAMGRLVTVASKAGFNAATGELTKTLKDTGEEAIREE